MKRHNSLFNVIYFCDWIAIIMDTNYNVLPCMSFSSRTFDKLWHWDVAEVVSPIEDLKKDEYTKQIYKINPLFFFSPSISTVTAVHCVTLCLTLSGEDRYRILTNCTSMTLLWRTCMFCFKALSKARTWGKYQRPSRVLTPKRTELTLFTSQQP